MNTTWRFKCLRCCKYFGACNLLYKYSYNVLVQNLPASQLPEVFGMHENVDISKELAETKQMFDNVLLTQGRGAGGGGSTDDALYAIADDVLKKLPENFDLEAAGEKFPVVYNESMNTVLTQEMERFNK